MRGEYPQSYVGDELNDILVSKYNEGTLTATGKTYCAYNGEDSDEIATDFDNCKVAEYLYEGKRYVCIDSPTNYACDPYQVYLEGKTYNNKTLLAEHRYFFVVEPILFRVMEINDGVATIISNNAIVSAYGTWDVLKNIGMEDIAQETTWSYRNINVEIPNLPLLITEYSTMTRR